MRPKSRASSRADVSDGDELQYGELVKLLKADPAALQDWVTQNVSLDTLEKWTSKRAKKLKQTAKPTRGQSNLSKWKYSAARDKTAVLAEMSGHLGDAASKPTDKGQVMYELTRCIAAAIDADLGHLYLVETEGQIVRFPTSQGEGPESQVIGPGGSVAAYSAYARDVVRATNSGRDARFPGGVLGLQGNARILCHPICSGERELEAVVEFVRTQGNAFTEEEIEKVNSYLVWGGPSLFYADKIAKLHQERFMSDFLVSVVTSIFNDMINMDSLIIQVMHQVVKLVEADRASLFLLDQKTMQLYARIFGVTGQMDGEEVRQVDDPAQGKLRFPVERGLAGHVATTGEPVIVHDCNKDARFYPGVDTETSYKTKSMICLPVKIRGTVMGVLQLLNKQEDKGAFTQEDLELFEVFASYIGLALHHGKLYDKIRKNEQKYKVVQEVVAYHNVAPQSEVEEVMKEGVVKAEDHQDIAQNIYSFYGLGMDNMIKARKAIFMFTDLFGLERFEYRTVVTFILAVKTNYRNVIYHNFSHGFHVANSVYSILKASPGIFTPLESLAMFVGAICHDLDHRGFNNKFMIDISSPLAGIYSTSTMENHHFAMGVSVLQQEPNNILANLNHEEYKAVLSNMKHCILATDLALFFPNKARLSNIVKENTFDWQHPDHRKLAQSLCLTGSDLNSSSKPWNVQLKVSDIVYGEFHEQGDVELALGWNPIPLFNRANYPELASMQVGFFGGICIPCYDLLTKVMPTVQPMLDQCKANLEEWKKLKEEREAEKAEAKAKEEAEKALAEEDGEKKGIEEK